MTFDLVESVSGVPRVSKGFLPGIVLGHQVQVVQRAVVELHVGHQGGLTQVVGGVCVTHRHNQ